MPRRAQRRVTVFFWLTCLIGEPDLYWLADRLRDLRQTGELIEDYVELISELIADRGEARQVDIAACLGVAQPTVAKMLQRLEQEGLVTRKPYRGTFLTEAGQKLAAKSHERHRVVEQFLICLGVDPGTARRDAEGIEHHVSAETLSVFRAFIKAHL